MLLSRSPGILERVTAEWVQLAVAHTPGGSLHAPIPGQVRSPTQYLTGWTRDFIAVLAPG